MPLVRVANLRRPSPLNLGTSSFATRPSQLGRRSFAEEARPDQQSARQQQQQQQQEQLQNQQNQQLQRQEQQGQRDEGQLEVQTRDRPRRRDRGVARYTDPLDLIFGGGGRQFLDPFSSRFDRRLDRLMRQIVGDIETPFNSPEFRELTREIADWNPTADVESTNDAFIINAELPGVNKSDIKIEVADGVLTIRGEKKREKEEEDPEKRVHRRESVYGTFQRSFELPEGVDPGQIKAKYENGVLRVIVPKSQATEAKVVNVE